MYPKRNFDSHSLVRWFVGWFVRWFVGSFVPRKMSFLVGVSVRRIVAGNPSLSLLVESRERESRSTSKHAYVIDD